MEETEEERIAKKLLELLPPRYLDVLDRMSDFIGTTPLAEIYWPGTTSVRLRELLPIWKRAGLYELMLLTALRIVELEGEPQQADKS